jgi:hypothetical protein
MLKNLKKKNYIYDIYLKTNVTCLSIVLIIKNINKLLNHIFLCEGVISVKYRVQYFQLIMNGKMNIVQ